MAMSKEVFFGASWGCTAELDAFGLFCSPLKLTGVHQDGDAAAAGLRVGDVIVSWSRAMKGAPCYQSVTRTKYLERAAAGLDRPFFRVDDETQEFLRQGGECRMRVHLVLRCSTFLCQGTVVEHSDSSDSCLLCDQCGVHQAFPLPPPLLTLAH